MIQRAWFFGDSFIYGYGMHPTTPDSRTMSEIVSDELECEEKNVAKYGYSNENIINSILLNLENLHKNDYVFIFDSHSVRAPYVNKKDSYYKDWISGSYFELDDDEIEQFYGLRVAFEKKLWEYYSRQFESIRSHLHDIGINSYYFPSNNNFWKWNKFKTSMKYQDHWNPEGHKQAARWVLDTISGKKVM